MKHKHEFIEIANIDRIIPEHCGCGACDKVYENRVYGKLVKCINCPEEREIVKTERL